MQQKKQTSTARTAAQMLITKQEVCLLLQITEVEYAQMQYNSGLSFLAYKCPSGLIENLVANSKIFWSFWKINWALRDEEFTEQFQKMEITPQGELIINDWGNMNQYLVQHSPYLLASKIDDYGSRLHDTWLQIKNFITQAH